MKLQTVYIPTGEPYYNLGDFTIKHNSPDAELREQKCEEVKDVYVLTEAELEEMKNEAKKEGAKYCCNY